MTTAVEICRMCGRHEKILLGYMGPTMISYCPKCDRSTGWGNR